MRKHHGLLYLVEFGIIGIGFALLLTLQLTFIVQLALLGSILFLYVVVGLLHHHTHHDVSGKVVVEYILISVLLVSLFIFLNISRI